MSELIEFKEVLSRTDLKEALGSFEVKSKLDAIKVIHFMSALNANEKDLKSKAYDFLLNRCKTCDVYEVEGLQVKKIERFGKVLDETQEYKDAKKKLEELEAFIEEDVRKRYGDKLDEAKAMVEYYKSKCEESKTEEPINTYFKAV